MTEKNKIILQDTVTVAIRPSDRITNAANGLFYISETDAEMIPFVWTNAESVTAEKILELAATTGDQSVETAEPEVFFARLTQVRDWYGDREKAKAARFAELYRVLKTELSDLHVFRIGRIRIDIIIVGIDGEGRLAGVRTVAVET